MGNTIYNFQKDDYNSPELLEDSELDEHVLYLKALSSEVGRSIDLYVKELNKRCRK